jgi:hypothetical protein
VDVRSDQANLLPTIRSRRICGGKWPKQQMLRHRKKRSDKLPGNNDFISKCKYFDLDISSNGKLDFQEK